LVLFTRLYRDAGQQYVKNKVIVAVVVSDRQSTNYSYIILVNPSYPTFTLAVSCHLHQLRIQYTSV